MWQNFEELPKYIEENFTLVDEINYKDEYHDETFYIYKK